MFSRFHARHVIVAAIVSMAPFLWSPDPGIRAAEGGGPGNLPASPIIAEVAAPPAASPAPAAPQSGTATPSRQIKTTDAAGRSHTRTAPITQAERQAAAGRLKTKVSATGTQTLLARQATATGVVALPGALQANQLLIAPNGQLIPDYSGLTPNYANSPMPTVATIGVPMTAGNSTTADRAFASDYPVAVGQLAPVLVVLPNSALPAGTLASFETWNQTTLGGSPFASAGNVFQAFVLRPTGTAGQYLVVYDSGPLTIPAPANPAGEVASFPVAGTVAVLAGDVIGFYGQGIPLDTGGANADILSYPAAAPPLANATITLPSAEFPVLGTDRTYSFAATVTVGTTSITGGIRKFVDRLPGLTPAGANGLGQYIPIATPDIVSYPGSDYYEIELREYARPMHSDLPATTLRGYRQTNFGTDVAACPATGCTAANNTVAPPVEAQYLGPLVVAQKGRPVRVKFRNNLPTGVGGNLFIPVDATVMGAGPGPNVTDAQRTATTGDLICKPLPGGTVPPACFTENRATIHLHGGVTPWISDGTTHQWITPAGEATAYPKGVSVFNVPDMPNPGKPASPDPGAGEQTFYYTNDQSARLMFYHDHAHGITRLNVYVGEAAGYLLTDRTEQDLANGTNVTGVNPAGLKVLPADQIPLVIQDKTFVDASTIGIQDPTWNWGSGAIDPVPYVDANGDTTQRRIPKTGDLWWPHVYMPAQNPYDVSGLNAMGRWHYGPWFWPPAQVTYGPAPNPYYQPDCALAPTDPLYIANCTMPWQPPEVPSTPNPSVGAEAFLDTPVINGTAYPTITVDPKAYRFRILNAAHDRFWNLQLYIAADKTTSTTAIPDPTLPATVLCNGGVPAANCTEVKMVPAAPNTGLPAAWPADGREGGLPDPTTKGPDFIQIGTEGGFLPAPVVVPNQPIAWNMDPTTFNFGNVSDHALLLGPAERADVIVDFSAYAGKTLILYNDAPAAFPALDARNDYYTGAPDRTDTGGVAGTLPGYGPNIRTIMQIQVGGGAPTPYDAAALSAVWAPDPAAVPPKPGVFEQSQDKVIVGQAAYNGVYTDFRTTPPTARTFPSTFPYWGLARIQDGSMGVETVDGPKVTLNLEPKAIHDEMGMTFDDYGRMSTALGLSLPVTAGLQQNFVLQGYADPPTELIKLSNVTNLIGYEPDGTQIWKITHNGVDTHPVHFHLFHVQLINRVGWDGAIRLPEATELGWKDTLRISPLEDTIVALRPIAPAPSTLPAAWGELPNSIRPLEPALPIGSTLAFENIDPQGNPITPGITNQLTNFGWEYIWHCHILSHEENDMMRAIGFAAPPRAPATLAAVAAGANRVRLTWADLSAVESGYRVERALDRSFTSGLTVFNLPANTTAFNDNTRSTTPYAYRVQALNTIGSSVPGYPTMTAGSDWATVFYNNPPVALGVPRLFEASAMLVTSRKSTTETVTLTWAPPDAVPGMVVTGYTIQRATDPGFTTGLVTANVGAVTTLTQTGLARTAYYYRIRATNGAAFSVWANATPFPLPAK